MSTLKHAQVEKMLPSAGGYDVNFSKPMSSRWCGTHSRCAVGTNPHFDYSSLSLHTLCILFVASVQQVIAVLECQLLQLNEGELNEAEAFEAGSSDPRAQSCSPGNGAL